MQTYSCMLCKKNDKDFINISYKNGRNCVKDDILELCGSAVEHYLQTDDLACSTCVKVLDNIARLKRQVCEIIIEHATNRHIFGRAGSKALNLSKVWDIRLTSTSSICSSYEGSAGTTSPSNLLVAASPNNLLVVTGSIPYDQRSETDIEEANNKYRYYDCDTPALDREVQYVNSRRRRRVRGHKWTRRKGSQKGRNQSRLSAQTERYSRSSRTTVNSRVSRTSSKRQQVQKHSEETQMKRILSDFLYHNDSLSQFTRAYVTKYIENMDAANFDCEEWSANAAGKPVVKTRFASEIRDKLLAEYEQLIYECPQNSCHEILWSVEDITNHRINKHKETPMFFCEQCNFGFLSQEHLDKHQIKHNKKFLAYCIYCSEEFRNKSLYEDHLNEHLIHSFPCIYCDKFFLKKQLCDNHIREQHPGRKKKIKKIKPQSILDRIDKYPNGIDLTRSTSQSNSQEFVVKVLTQCGRPELPEADEDYEIPRCCLHMKALNK